MAVLTTVRSSRHEYGRRGRDRDGASGHARDALPEVPVLACRRVSSNPPASRTSARSVRQAWIAKQVARQDCPARFPAPAPDIRCCGRQECAAASRRTASALPGPSAARSSASMPGPARRRHRGTAPTGLGHPMAGCGRRTGRPRGGVRPLRGDRPGACVGVAPRSVGRVIDEDRLPVGLGPDDDPRLGPGSSPRREPVSRPTPVGSSGLPVPRRTSTPSAGAAPRTWSSSAPL